MVNKRAFNHKNNECPNVTTKTTKQIHISCVQLNTASTSSFVGGSMAMSLV